mmetsp:Transcript_16854/g.39353  ORF Transcript_16854/g.39353 Transcript_16854/m.39353 type:complete len:222 (-) Transcript_16854:1311-1976(-)
MQVPRQGRLRWPHRRAAAAMPTVPAVLPRHRRCCRPRRRRHHHRHHRLQQPWARQNRPRHRIPPSVPPPRSRHCPRRQPRRQPRPALPLPSSHFRRLYLCLFLLSWTGTPPSRPRRAPDRRAPTRRPPQLRPLRSWPLSTPSHRCSHRPLHSARHSRRYRRQPLAERVPSPTSLRPPSPRPLFPHTRRVLSQCHPVPWCGVSRAPSAICPRSRSRASEWSA